MAGLGFRDYSYIVIYNIGLEKLVGGLEYLYRLCNAQAKPYKALRSLS